MSDLERRIDRLERLFLLYTSQQSLASCGMAMDSEDREWLESNYREMGDEIHRRDEPAPTGNPEG